MNPMKSCYLDRHVSWSELPSELLPSIAKHLNTRADILNFRGVSTTWKSSAALSLISMKNILSTFFPLQLPNDDPVELSHPPKVLLKSSVLLLQSTKNPDLSPYLLFIEEFIPGKLSLRYPLTDNVNEILHNGFPNTLDMSQFIVSELGTFVTINYLYDNSNNLANLQNKNGRRPTGLKAVLFFDPHYKTQPSINECSIVEMSNSISLYVTRLGSKEKRKVTFKGRKLEDIVSFNDKIYAIDRTGKVCCMDYHSLKMVSIAEDSVCAGAGLEGRKYLAAAPDGLFLIYRWWRKNQPAFKIFRLNEAEERWDYVKGIGEDRILFINFSECFFASAQNFLGWVGNIIVFHEGSFKPYSGPSYDHMIFRTPNWYHHQDVAVYHVDSGACFLATSKPMYFKTVGPPPSWLWTNPSLDTGGRNEVKKEELDFEIREEGQYDIAEEDFFNNLVGYLLLNQLWA